MHSLYPEYYDQSWYQNSFLVDTPAQISQATTKSIEWNNISESGCHFTCLAMIVGVDPARLASALVGRKYFENDPEIPATALTGEKTNLVWDRNRPWAEDSAVILENFWHPAIRRNATVNLRCVDYEERTSVEDVVKLTTERIANGLHVILGYVTHSVLVAGFHSNGPFIWDPNSSEKSREPMLNGEMSLVEFAARVSVKKPVCIHTYSCSVAS